MLVEEDVFQMKIFSKYIDDDIRTMAYIFEEKSSQDGKMLQPFNIKQFELIVFWYSIKIVLA